MHTIQSELVDNTSKLTEIDKSMKTDCKKLKEVEDNPNFFEEQRQLYRETTRELEG